MKIIISVLALLLVTSAIYSQSRDSLVSLYNTQTIYNFGNKFIKGDQKLTYKDLEKEFTSTSTVLLYKKSKSRLAVSRIFNVASLGVIIASIFTKTTVNGSIEFALGTGALALGGQHFQTNSAKFLDRAIWEHNREVLTGYR